MIGDDISSASLHLLYLCYSLKLAEDLHFAGEVSLVQFH